MNILQIANQVAIRSGDLQVQTLFSNADNTNDILGYILQSANEIAIVNNWSVLAKDGFIVVDGISKEFDLPGDFQAMASYNIYNITQNRVLPMSTDDNELSREAWKNTSSSNIMWRIMGGKFVFTIPPENSETLKYTYISKNFVKSVDPETFDVTYQDFFDKNYQTFLISDELLILKTLAVRSLTIGLEDASKREQDYQNRLSFEISKDGGKYKTNLFSSPIFNKTSPIEFQEY